MSVGTFYIATRIKALAYWATTCLIACKTTGTKHSTWGCWAVDYWLLAVNLIFRFSTRTWNFYTIVIDTEAMSIINFIWALNGLEFTNTITSRDSHVNSWAFVFVITWSPWLEVSKLLTKCKFCWGEIKKFLLVIKEYWILIWGCSVMTSSMSRGGCGLTSYL